MEWIGNNEVSCLLQSLPISHFPSLPYLILPDFITKSNSTESFQLEIIYVLQRYDFTVHTGSTHIILSIILAENGSLFSIDIVLLHLCHFQCISYMHIDITLVFKLHMLKTNDLKFEVGLYYKFMIQQILSFILLHCSIVCTVKLGCIFLLM